MQLGTCFISEPPLVVAKATILDSQRCIEQSLHDHHKTSAFTPPLRSRRIESIPPALFTADPHPSLAQKRLACILFYEIFITGGEETKDVLIFHTLLKLHYSCVTTGKKNGHVRVCG